MDVEKYKIAAFYRFLDLGPPERLTALRENTKREMVTRGILGTVVFAGEGINSTICGTCGEVDGFIDWLSETVGAKLAPKFSYVERPPFRKIDVKVKPEIVTLKKKVEISLGNGTHVRPEDWNRLISDPDVVLLDTRNDYEFRTGTFDRAINPQTDRFSDLPDYVAKNLDPAKHKKVAMFCTGGIRCEKFAPYMKSLGFESVFQLEGGILKYLEEVPIEQQLWRGDCYVFDTRVSVDAELRPADTADLSQEE
jgi:UPF0176 protein